MFGYGEVRGPTLGGWDLGQGQRNLSPGRTSRMEELQPPDGASGSAKPEGSSPTPAAPQSCWGLQALGLHSPPSPGYLPLLSPQLPLPAAGAVSSGRDPSSPHPPPPPTPAVPTPSSGASTTPSRGQLAAPAAPVPQAVTLGGVCLRSRQACLGAAQPGGRRWAAPARLGRRISQMDLQGRLSGRKGILGRPEPSQGWNQTAFFEEHSREK